MIQRIINNSHGHPLKNPKIFFPNYYNCVACSQGKLIIKLSITKVVLEFTNFLEIICGNICGFINPPCRPF